MKSSVQKWILVLSCLFFLGVAATPAQASLKVVEPKWSAEASGKASGQYSAFPVPLNVLNQEERAWGKTAVWEKITYRAKKDPFNVAATVIFILAIIHTFLTSYFVRLSHYFAQKHEKKLEKKGIHIEHPEGHYPVSFLSSVFHFLGEVEAVFGIWVIPLMLAAFHYHSFEDFKLYLDHDCSFIEPMFVTVIMIVASSRPVFRFVENIMKAGAALGKETPTAWWFSVMCIAPLLGSVVTEPAAMTIGAMILGKRFYALRPKATLAYASLGLLFVSISVGGTLTHFAAPPVVMIAEKWGWNMTYMLTHFGWKAFVAIFCSTAIYFFLFRKEFKRLDEVEVKKEKKAHLPEGWEGRKDKVPVWVTLVHLGFLAWTVVFAHVPILFIGGFVFFLGFIIATPHHQNHVILRIPLMVGFFLAGLVILGGLQAWWLEPVLTSLNPSSAMLGATILTAFNDNAAVTYLASTVPGLSESMKYAVVAGAVTGGGLTVIANAPNPAGQAILGKYFLGINPLNLFLAAILPTVIVYLAFTFLATL